MKKLIYRPPEERTFSAVVQLSQVYRRTLLPPNSFDAALQQAAAELVGKTGFTQPYKPQLPQPQKSKPQDTPPPPKRPVVTEHREIVFRFADGSEIASCSATGCRWGYGHHKQKGLQWRKTHSDRLPHSLIEVEVDEQETEPEELEVELSLDDVRELSVESVIQPLEDRDEDELEVAEPELGTDDEDEPQDEAEFFEEVGEREC